MGHDDFQSEGVGQATRPKRVQHQLDESRQLLDYPLAIKCALCVDPKVGMYQVGLMYQPVSPIATISCAPPGDTGGGLDVPAVAGIN